MLSVGLISLGLGEGTGMLSTLPDNAFVSVTGLGNRSAYPVTGGGCCWCLPAQAGFVQALNRIPLRTH